MSLTKGTGPFGRDPGGVFNFRARPPEGHTLYFEDCDRRVRTVFAGETIADSRRVKLLHETGLTPVYYFPEAEVRTDLMEESDRSTSCPFKGVASYRSVVVGERRADDAVWLYPEPIEGCPPLGGYVAFYWDRMDHWFDEEREVFVHPRDPYHRVDVLPGARHVRVRVHGELVAETRRPRLLFETGLPVRYYIDPAEVREELLVDSDTETRCPYKGLARHKSIRAGGQLVEDVAWTYPEPLHDAAPVDDWIAFYPEKVDLEVD